MSKLACSPEIPTTLIDCQVVPGKNATLISYNRTGKRQCTSMNKEYENGKPGTTAMNEADSNADTCCLGVNFVILSYTLCKNIIVIVR